MLSWNELCLTGRHFIGRCLNGRVMSFQDRAPFHFGLLGLNAFRYIFPAFLKSVIPTELSAATTIWGV